MDASKKTISDVLNGNRILKIPFFQRSYVWEEKQWERFLDDMEMVSITKKNYFMGSIILKQEHAPSSTKVGDIRQIVDGQQRLTTISIFFKCLCQKTNKESVFERFFLLLDKSVAIEHNYNDYLSFEKIMKKTDTHLFPKPKNQIESLYNYIIQQDLTRFDIQAILNHIIFVGIDLFYDEDEQKIFDTINSLGVKLTTPELLKNYFFNKSNVNLFHSHWKNIFEKDEESRNYWDTEVTSGSRQRSYLEIFFYSVLQIMIQTPDFAVSSADKIQYARVEELFNSYKDFIDKYLNNNKIQMLETLKKYYEVFIVIFDDKWESKHIERNDYVARINNIVFGLDTASIIPYLLYISYENINNPIENLYPIFAVIESYLMRRMITKHGTKSYNGFFNGTLINNRINTEIKLNEFLKKERELSTLFPSLEELENGFLNSKLTNKQAAGVIYLIESQTRQIGQSTQLKPFNQYQLEHLMPKKWQQYWNTTPLNENQIEKRNSCLLTLGNLAIISEPLNKSILNKDWKTKKEGNKDNKGLLLLSGGIETLAKYLSFESWDERTITIRAKDLFNLSAKIWSF
jgi:uncharacterized protein with ParB-like and HNH nuclease domain